MSVYTDTDRDDLSFVETDLDDIAQAAMQLLKHTRRLPAQTPDVVRDSLINAAYLMIQVVNALCCEVCHHRLAVRPNGRHMLCLDCAEGDTPRPYTGPSLH